MKMRTLFAAAAGLLLTAGAAQAAPINVGGVVWDPDSGFDLRIGTFDLRENAIGAVGDELTGFGKIGNINNTGESTFCPGCELTVVFDGFIVQELRDTDGDASTIEQVVFSGGSARFYVDDSENYDASMASASDGDLWLELAAHEHFRGGDFDTTGTLFSNITGGDPAQPGTDSSGFALFDVVGGSGAPANPYFDTNTVASSEGLADFSFNSSYQFEEDSPTGPEYPITGSGDLQGDSVAIPEPASLGLMGIGLLGLSALSRRRRNKA